MSKNSRVSQFVYDREGDEGEMVLDRAFLSSSHRGQRVAFNLRYGRFRRSRLFFQKQAKLFRAMLKRKYPKGLPMYSRPSPWRCVVLTSDLVHLTGMGIRTAQRLLAEIRASLNKKPRAFITIMEFCHHTEMPESYVQSFLNHIPLSKAMQDELKLQMKLRQHKGWTDRKDAKEEDLKFDDELEDDDELNDDDE